MEYRVSLHEKAEGEISQIYESIRARGGPFAAGRYVGGLYDFIAEFRTFPKRGTVREGPVPGLRIVGYKRSASVAFVVENDSVIILGVFYRGRNVTPEMLEDRI